jgi:DNA-binding transcriptional ArsR family regulator
MNESVDHVVLSDLRQIKALADPLRQRILSALCAPRTTMQVAVLLGEPPTKLYRHVDQLEELGLIKLVRTAPKRGTTEKYFQAVARKFSLAGDTLTGGKRGVQEEFYASVLNDMLSDVRRGLSSEQSPEMMLGIVRFTPERLREFLAGVEVLMSEFKTGTEEGELYKFLTVLAPAPPSDEEI